MIAGDVALRQPCALRAGDHLRTGDGQLWSQGSGQASEETAMAWLP
jgi:hypothetical protein